MKTNFNSKLFEKKIDLESSNSILGGARGTGCTITNYSYENGSQSDQTTNHYNEEGHLTKIEHCYE